MYEMMAEKLRNNTLLVATVIKGLHCGEKAVFCEGNMLFADRDESFFEHCIDTVTTHSENGIISFEGEEIFCDHAVSGRQLVICGGGHVAIPVIKIGNMLGFHTVVLEDRPVFADHARRAGACEVICDNFASGLEQISDTLNTFYVIVTRGHQYDALCLEKIIEKKHSYIGMMGSRSRVAVVKDILEKKGVERQLLEQVHSPIGLNIGAQTPEEIAVSIMAEIVQVKCAKGQNDSYTEELLERLIRVEQSKEKAVLVTIISRNGSAPREIGTKMLITEDTMITGTIGGGCIEAAAYQKGIRMLKDKNLTDHVMKIDMSNENAQNSGMACGGTIEVFLEKINM